MKTNRRNFIHTLGATTAGIGLGSLTPGCAPVTTSSAQETDLDEQQLFVGDDIAIAQTQYGKVQGFLLRGIYHFRGIPYGADTSGKNRFMPPQPPDKWEGTRPAVWWGNSAPQLMDNRYGNAWASFADHWNYDDVSENCLMLNVWTPAIDSSKRPVMVWLHGGGYTNGNGIEQDGYGGENLSRKGDVVFVSINHRLGPLGFSDLSGVGGEKYLHSGNVGVIDLAFALQWIKDNIGNFGGDPGNVTIMGQSGGGAKVCVLTAMPETQGLLHKAVALSGSSVEAIKQGYSRKVGEYILKEAGLAPGSVDKLQEIPWKDYILLANSASRKAMAEIGTPGQRGGFGPVADGVHLPEGKFFADREGVSTEVPLLLCTTFHEWNGTRTDPEMEKISLDKVKEMVKERTRSGEGLADKAGEVVDAYAALFPEAKPAELLALINSNRKNVIAAADAKAVQKAPVYVAWFGWQPPLFNGRMRAFHCLDICFWYANTDVMLTHTGGGKRPRLLADRMSGTLLQFMRTGDPNGGGLPLWSPYSVENGETMVLNDLSELKNDPDRAARRLI